MANTVKRLGPLSSTLPDGGGSGAKYVVTFNSTTSWSGPSLFGYSISVLESLHGISNPKVQVYELIAGQFELVTTQVQIDNSYNVTITVSSSPDLRFAGKIIIS